MDRIQFTSGCPNNCAYCYEPIELNTYSPKVPEDTEVQILDMNFLYNPDAIKILKRLPKGNYEFVCGLDYRRLDQEICDLIHEKGFKNIRWAWDYGFSQQKIHKNVLNMFKKAGYEPKTLSIFVLVNWKTPFIECMNKLDLMKVWNVKVNDCCYDGGYPKNEVDFNNNPRFINKRFWTYPQIKQFRKKSRKHNQFVRFGIDPELKSRSM